MVSFHRSASAGTAELEAPVAAPSGGLRATAFPRVNLMPEVVAVEARTRRAKSVLAGAAAASVVVVGGLWVFATMQVDSAQSQLDAANAQHASLNTQQAKYADVPRVNAELSAAQGQLTQAMGSEVRWSVMLTNLSLTLPAGVSLNAFTGQVADSTGSTGASGGAGGQGQFVSVLGNPGIGTITYSGDAQSYGQVSTFLDVLARQATLIDPYATNVSTTTSASTGAASATTTSGVSFTATTTVTPLALSHRYDQKAGS